MKRPRIKSERAVYSTNRTIRKSSTNPKEKFSHRLGFFDWMIHIKNVNYHNTDAIITRA